MNKEGSCLKVAAIQMCSMKDKEKNLKVAQDLMVAAVKEGADLIALPENFSYMGGEGDVRPAGENIQEGQSIVMLQEFAKEYQVAIVGGSIAVSSGQNEKYTNTCLVIDRNGQVIGRYDKIHLFDVSLENRVFQESAHFCPGINPKVVDLLGVKIGLSICYDLRFPELYRWLTVQGAKILFVPAAFTDQTGEAHWEILLRSRAIENQCYVVAPAQFGQHDNDRKSFGQTMIVDPWGRVLEQCPDRESFVVCDLDFSYLDKVRKNIPCLKHIKIAEQM